MSHTSLRRRRCVLAVTVAAVAATPFAAAPAAHATGGRTVTTSMSSAVHVAVHDPADTFHWPGDTHELHLNLKDTDGPGTIDVVSFDCGPHDPARTPEELACPAVDQIRLDIWEPKATVRNGSIDWRVTTDVGPLRLRLTDSTHQRWVSDAWERAEGTRYQSSREERTRYTGSVANGTVAGLALTQPAAWREQSRSEGSRTVERVWRGRAVPVPVLPPVGAGEMGDESHGRASVTWVRPLPDGTALYGHVWADAVSVHSGFGPMAAAVVSRQRCDAGEEPVRLGEDLAPGRCDVLEWLANDAMDNPYAFAFDNRLGTASLSGRSTTEPNAPRPREFHDLTASWPGGGEAVGTRYVRRLQEDPQWGNSVETTTESGITWRRPAAQATWEGQPVQVTEATMRAYRLQTRITTP